MKKRTTALISLLCCAALVLTACGSSSTATATEAAPEESETEAETEAAETVEAEAVEPELEDYYLVTNVYGDGQKAWYVVLEYNTPIDPSSVSVGSYEVTDYELAGTYTNDEASVPDSSIEGKYVIIELGTDYYTQPDYGGGGPTNTEYQYGSRADDDQPKPWEQEGYEGGGFGGPNGGGPDGGGEGPDDGDEGEAEEETVAEEDLTNRMEVTFKQTSDISSAAGAVLAADGEEYTTDYTKNVNLLVENFELYTTTLSNGTEIMYSLYIPEGYDESTKYPLMTFMPDAVGEGNDPYLALTESYGGVNWSTDEWQSKYETIVLIPQYTKSNGQDPENTIELINYICDEYSVDTDRLYLSGDSSGTIRSIKMLIDHPDMFAASYLVAGQADSAYEDKLDQLADQKIWMLCSEGDARAYPGMTAIKEAVESKGTEVSTSQFSAKIPYSEQDEYCAEQAAEGKSINWSVYDAETVMEDDVSISDGTEHMNTWRHAYYLDVPREWVFSQVLGEDVVVPEFDIAAAAGDNAVSTASYTVEEVFDEVGITVQDLASAGGAWVMGLDKDESQLKFLKAAALLGYGDAAFSLGESYHSGNAYDADQYDDLVTEAVNWWEMAGANGSPRGWDDIGLLYLHQSVPGGGDDYGDIPYDEDIAFDYFQRATDAGDAKAPRHLAECYENGWGCEPDDAKAFESYVIASERNDSTATVEVADRYLEGRGVDQDVETAMAMYQKIVDDVDHDVVTCAYKLGEIYENGEYVDADNAKAAEYYQISLDNANEGSPDYTKAEEALARVSG